ncbi:MULTISPECIES: M23 family metallopeptidase [unclassified Paenibacillus]|uniref:LysM peptidoglycan-binding domain-containing M23 family metallopeptidase n=1 Tax=unclassified Paenibacillus TaxID=185978 RepID=UPI001AE4FD54|nr:MULTISPECIES: M23 family metallopeptidase [unclassified Paenibacillus]MBP1153284.1 murein DD-endopeptidase MepM/ murein hydrolase activator NlpD [Paenibacillus sp. PvP091]MBP1171333.1 murein DD-endopeptidase MepM/ murein hydrolase activator NlpD [Paenibacillus sp. PvR098]MBP2442361.1 murein DD-endopeptidase MepM/ murein hydrolase activator NlpD [Paenibacillus sp. PvP052]
MTVFKIMDQFKGLLKKLRNSGAQNGSDSLAEGLRIEPVTKEQGTTALIQIKNRMIEHKWLVIKSVSTLGLIAVVAWSGNQYVQANMKDIYHVYANGDSVGTVSDPAMVEQFKQQKREQLASNGKDIRMVVQEPRLELTTDRVFGTKADDQAVLQQLDRYFSAYPVGVQLLVDGKPVGIVKDQATAKQILEQIKANAIASIQQKKEPGKVGILSAAPESSVPVETELQKADFVQNVEMKELQIEPDQLMKPDELLNKLEKGNVQPTKYTVEDGDCVSCIAKKLNIPKQVIYQNNPWISNDMIKVGEQLDLTVLQPALSVRTVEKVVENQEIQYETEYKQDDSLRLGETQVLAEGKQGLKKVTLQLTKVNGLMEEESVLSEEIVQQPVKAVVKRGTKVVRGEGSGKFAWPVVSASISSTYGMRWGAFHKGIDLTGNRNILASDNGKVEFAGVKDGYGKLVIIDHMNGYRTLYAHLSKVETTNGAIVEKGEKIGTMGSTGDSTGVHLHFEILRDQSPQNPLKFLNR